MPASPSSNAQEAASQESAKQGGVAAEKVDNAEVCCVSTVLASTETPQANHCPYHASILQMLNSNNSSSQNLSPMDRFLKEGPHEQSAAFCRPDTGKLSISKGCKCGHGEMKDL